MNSSFLKMMVGKLRSGLDVSRDEAEPLLDAMISETDELLLADTLRAWNAKGIAEEEIFETAKIMRSRMKRVRSRHDVFVDIVGTGGSKAKSFNVSTAAAFVVAGAGVPVAKHGNKAATSSSGSADVLAELGVDPAVDPHTAERCLNEIGLCFMFAPNHHRLSPTLGKVRRGLGFPTIFNCVGPLCNPASAPHQLIGVWDKELMPKMANALARLGTKRSWMVHGEDGLDEISITGRTYVAEIEDGKVSSVEITPDEFNIATGNSEGIQARTPMESASLIREVLSGGCRETPAESIVLTNAAAAFYLAGCAANIDDGYALAADSIRSGSAIKKLEQLSEAVRK
ncbi:MAG TPA: anthranilate phosphoribosyltransferase [Pyrinomonadaceae bacterium]|nr:anthranilate phosphoribosyltransferase [Pyrinomonadaceae bacterium]HMP64847.1 anthranilate phosphoribosyltransferase [Pyrinomonadaceae bacterium]